MECNMTVKILHVSSVELWIGWYQPPPGWDKFLCNTCVWLKGFSLETARDPCTLRWLNGENPCSFTSTNKIIQSTNTDKETNVLNNWIHNTIAIKHNSNSVHYSLKWLARKAVIPSCQIQFSSGKTWKRRLIAQKTTRISVKLMDAPRIASIHELLSEWYA